WEPTSGCPEGWYGRSRPWARLGRAYAPGGRFRGTPRVRPAGLTRFHDDHHVDPVRGRGGDGDLDRSGRFLINVQGLPGSVRQQVSLPRLLPEPADDQGAVRRPIEDVEVDLPALPRHAPPGRRRFEGTGARPVDRFPVPVHP